MLPNDGTCTRTLKPTSFTLFLPPPKAVIALVTSVTLSYNNIKWLHSFPSVCMFVHHFVAWDITHFVLVHYLDISSFFFVLLALFLSNRLWRNDTDCFQSCVCWCFVCKLLVKSKAWWLCKQTLLGLWVCSFGWCFQCFFRVRLQRVVPTANPIFFFFHSFCWFLVAVALNESNNVYYWSYSPLSLSQVTTLPYLDHSSHCGLFVWFWPCSLVSLSPYMVVKTYLAISTN